MAWATKPTSVDDTERPGFCQLPLDKSTWTGEISLNVNVTGRESPTMEEKTSLDRRIAGLLW